MVVITEQLIGINGKPLKQYLCRCDCGNEKVQHSSIILAGRITSCGCKKKTSGPSNPAFKHGASRGRRPKEYGVWLVMKDRCRNPRNKRFDRYGGRGIEVCERWNEYENFIADMGPRPSGRFSVERVNNDGHYEPRNCKWGTDSEQVRNTCRNVNIEHDGKVMCLVDWANHFGIARNKLRWQYQYKNLPFAEAVAICLAS